MRIFLDFQESLRIALSAIAANKARGVLTTLGIVIGIVAVTTTMTAFNGMQTAFREGASAVGADVIYVSRMPWIVMGDWFMYRNRPNISIDEAESLEEAFEGRAIVNPTMNEERSMKYRANVMDDVTIIGTTDKLPIVTGRVPETGRFLLPYDVKYKKNVVVIGTCRYLPPICQSPRRGRLEQRGDRQRARRRQVRPRPR
jgi:putative ABC transport system permease protein